MDNKQMEPNEVTRRYFRALPHASSCSVDMALNALGNSGIESFTGADYESAFSLYHTPCRPGERLSRRFDLVCLETEANREEMARVIPLFLRAFTEVTGTDRERIESQVCGLLRLAHRADTRLSDLPSSGDDSTLRPYQARMKNRIMEEWKREPRLMLQMPTGTGKTRLFVSLINDIHKGDPTARILIVTHRRELVEQASGALSSHYRLPHSILGKREQETDETILIASVQKLSRMQELPAADYIIIDEAHHSLAPSYRKLMSRFPSSRILGVTATPCRLRPAPFRDIFGKLLPSPSVRRFIEAGYLADYRLLTVSREHAAIGRVNRLTRFGTDGDYRVQDLQEIVCSDSETTWLYDCYKAFADGRRGIVYAVSRDHAAHIASQFNAHGVRAVALDCDTPAPERSRIVDEFRSGTGVKVLVNVELFTEGFDCPGVEFVMLARPTRSLAMYLQQVGRALRPLPGGSHSKVVILDVAGLYNRFGLPERRRDWETHFNGGSPQGEDYRVRPLGTPGLSGMMQEVTDVRTPDACSGWSVHDFGGGRLGVYGGNGRPLFPLLYDRLVPYAGSWLVGYRRSNGRETVADILVPDGRSVHTFLDFAEEGDGVFSVGVSRDRRLRFDVGLRLLPTASCELGGLTVYQHGADKSRCLYTLSLELGAVLYTGITRYVSGMAKLSSILHSGIAVLCRGEVFEMPEWNAYSARHIFSPDGSLHIHTDGTVFRRISEHPVLYLAMREHGMSLCDRNLHPLCHGDRVEVAPGGCIVYNDGTPLQRVSFVDVLCMGGISL